MFKKNSVEKIGKGLEKIVANLEAHTEDQDNKAIKLGSQILALRNKRDVCENEISKANSLSTSLHDILMRVK